MGISGLHNQVAPWGRRRNLADFAGQTLAVDAQGWLFRGCYSCARDLAMGVPTVGYVNFMFSRLDLLAHHGIRVVLVFDGRRSPMKESTSVLRRARQATEVAKGRETLRLADVARGRGDRMQAEILEKQAADHFGRGVKISDDMVTTAIAAVRRRPGVRVLVAPYEADPQLAALVYGGAASAIVTEDSDVCLTLSLSPGPGPKPCSSTPRSALTRRPATSTCRC
uniref:Exonuclease 1 n=1 Tax=Phaeomonas parva TaxID=124430 RepID=A0A7S1XXC8_9STRA|mmetsp:Transcript_6097/g.17032  ORF Transcript_6097/g.17032 Transcript_6097/m.17032 type:complete len:224 (+) Transcript_6097:111-782(+)